MKIKQKLALIIGFIGFTFVLIMLMNSAAFFNWSNSSFPSILDARMDSVSLQGQKLTSYQDKQKLLIALSRDYSQIPILFTQFDNEILTSRELSGLLETLRGDLANHWYALEAQASEGQLSVSFNYGFLMPSRRVVDNELVRILQAGEASRISEISALKPSFYGALAMIVDRLNQEVQLSHQATNSLLAHQQASYGAQQHRTWIFALIGLCGLFLLSWITLRNLIHPLRALVNLASGLVSKEEVGPTREDAYKDYQAAVNKVGQYVEFQAGWQEEMKVTIAQYAKGQYAEIKMVQGAYHPSYAANNLSLPDEYFESMKVIEQLRGRLVNMHQEIQHLSNANLQREYNYRFSANESA